MRFIAKISEKPAYRWLILSLAWSIYFSFGLITSAFAPLVTPIMFQLKLTYTEVGAIAGAWQLIYIFAAYPLGVLIDRLGCRRSLLLGVTIISISSLLRTFATNFETFFIYAALFGLGGPFISIGIPKLVASWFLGEERGVAAGINASGNSIGGATALALTNSFVLPEVGRWEMVFLSYSLIGFLIALLWILLGKSSPKGEIEAERIPRLGEGMKEILKLRSVWIIVIIGVAGFLVPHGLRNWMPRILEIKGYTAIEAGFLTSLLAISRIMGNLLIPRVSYLVGSKKRTLSVVLILSSVTLLALGVSEGLTLIAEIFIIGFLGGGILPLLLLMFMDMPKIGAKYMGVAGGLFFSIGEIGGFSGPFLIGFLKDLTGSFLAGFTVLSIYTGAMILLTLTIKE